MAGFEVATIGRFLVTAEARIGSYNGTPLESLRADVPRAYVAYNDSWDVALISQSVERFGMASVASLLAQLRDDPWRAEVGFSSDMEVALNTIHAPTSSDETIAEALTGWLSKHQPCLFGRIAARDHRIVTCVLRGEDLVSDELIKKKIQETRLKWTRLGYEGKVSGFIIVVVFPKLNRAKPDEVLRDIALKVCSLYLLQEIETDRVYTDSLYLEQPGFPTRVWEWVAGVNVFAAAADKRWWQDHRMPVGLAFSVNSVGHMVKSGQLTSGLYRLDEVMGTAEGEIGNQKIDSLHRALEFAMRTINLASNGPSGRATYLLPLLSESEGQPGCPIVMPKILADKDYRRYCGIYHTDVTVPASYFREDVQAPVPLETFTLDFTYLFDKSLDNPDHDRMGAGRQIRADEENGQVLQHEPYKAAKRLKSLESEIRLENAPRLLEALRKQF